MLTSSNNKDNNNLTHLISELHHQLLNKHLQGNKFILYTKDILNILEIFKLVINSKAISNELDSMEYISNQIQIQLEDYMKQTYKRL